MCTSPSRGTDHRAQIGRGPTRWDGIIEFGYDTLGRAVGDHRACLLAGEPRQGCAVRSRQEGQSGLTEGSPAAVMTKSAPSAGDRPGSPAGGTAGTHGSTTAGSPDPSVC